MERALPVGGAIGAGLFVLALGAYLATTSGHPLPGLPSDMLCAHLGMDGELPASDPIWGRLVRLAAKWPGDAVAGILNAFSAVCAAACVGLAAWLMGQTRYRGLMVDRTPERFAAEARARRLSCAVAGLYLACGVPFWTAATRSLPDAFHLLLLLAAACLLAIHRRDGKLRHLAGAGLVAGVGAFEYPTFALFAPIGLALAGYDGLRRGSWTKWRWHVALWAPFAAGLAAVPLLAAWQVRHAGAAGAAGALLAAGRALVAQLAGLAAIRFNAGFMAIMALSVVPWLLLFALSRRSPWHYGADQAAVRFLLAAGLVGILHGASFAPWTFLGIDYLMLPAQVLLATSTGLIAGEFWIMGRRELEGDASLPRRAARWACLAAACVLPVLVVAGGAMAARTANARPASRLRGAVEDALDRIRGRELLFTDGAMDSFFRLTARGRGQRLVAISLPNLDSPVYLRRLARQMPEEFGRVALAEGRVDDFFEVVLLDDEKAKHAATISRTDLLRRYAALEPDTLLYRFVAGKEAAGAGERAAGQRAFWGRMGEMAEKPLPEGSLLRPYEERALAWASHVANNLGVWLAETGGGAEAAEAFRAALRARPDNLSARMNLLGLARRDDLPELGELEATWEDHLDKSWDARWGLSVRYGYLLDWREWTRRGETWAASGMAVGPEAALRQHEEATLEDWEREWFLDFAHRLWEGEPGNELACFARLYQNERDVGAYRELCRLALRRGDYEAAEIYLDESEAAGLGAPAAEFERCMVAYARDGREAALRGLEELAGKDPANLDAWIALGYLAGPEGEAVQRALRAIKDLNPSDPGVHLAAAWLEMRESRWEAAQAELDAALALAPKSRAAWELQFALARALDNRQLLQNSRRTLLEVDPRHPLGAIQAAFAHIDRKEWDRAEGVLRKALGKGRNPDVLYALGNVEEERGGDLAESKRLFDEAALRQPFNPAFMAARAEWNIGAGRHEAAEEDLARLRRIQPEHLLVDWIDLEMRMARGERGKAIELVRKLAGRRDQLSGEQVERLGAWARKLKGP